MKTMLYLMGILILAACNVTDEPVSVPQEIVITATVATTPAQVATIQANMRPGCQPRTDWLPYTVVAGDTLFRIANWAGASIDDIAAASCLVNVNTIEVGQILRVPIAQPPTVTLAPSSTPPLPPLDLNASYQAPTSPAGALVIEGGNPQDLNTSVLEAGATVTIFWSGLDEGRETWGQVEFIYTPSNPTEDLLTFGIDALFTDGISVMWTVPDNLSGSIRAEMRPRGHNADGFYSPSLAVTSQMP